MQKGTFGHMQKGVDPDQLPCHRRSVWSGSALFDNHSINGTYFSSYVNNFIMNRCFQHCNGADLGLHYMKCPKVLFLRDAGHMIILCWQDPLRPPSVLPGYQPTLTKMAHLLYSAVQTKTGPKPRITKAASGTICIVNDPNKNHILLGNTISSVYNIPERSRS